MSENLMLDVDQAGELKAAFRRTRGSDGSQWTNAMIKKLSEGTVLGQVLDVLDGRSRVVSVNPNIYRLIVNYDQPITDAIAAGKYDWVNNDITQKNFPTNRSGKAEVEIELVHFNRVVSTKEALAELDKRGLRPAELHELLAFGANHPELQREFPIIGLASVWQDSYGSRFCPYLFWSGSERYLRLFWLGSGWSVYCRFAAVRK